MNSASIYLSALADPSCSCLTKLLGRTVPGRSTTPKAAAEQALLSEAWATTNLLKQLHTPADHGPPGHIENSLALGSWRHVPGISTADLTGAPTSNLLHLNRAIRLLPRRPEAASRVRDALIWIEAVAAAVQPVAHALGRRRSAAHVFTHGWLHLMTGAIILTNPTVRREHIASLRRGRSLHAAHGLSARFVDGIRQAKSRGLTGRDGSVLRCSTSQIFFVGCYGNSLIPNLFGLPAAVGDARIKLCMAPRSLICVRV